jgi:hypothetical protein
MSSNVTDVLSAITLASEALAREPKLKSQIYALENDLKVSQETVQSRELAIVEYKRQIDDLTNRNRSLEVERDQAQFRTLELEETIHNAVGIFKSASGNLSAALAVIDPPKPEPVVEQPAAEQVSGSYFADGEKISGSIPVPEQVTESQPPSNPTSESAYHSEPTPTADPVGFAGLTDTSVNIPGKFTGKRWSDIPASERTYFYTEWLANGGDAKGWNS